jgi:hypothetical protein
MLSGRLLLALMGCGALAAAFIPVSHQADEYASKTGPIIRKFCLPCHTGKSAAGKLDLSTTKSDAQVAKDTTKWLKVLSRLESHQMPPEGAAQPSKAQRKAVVEHLQAVLSKAGCEIKPPPAVTLRRLNRTEYNNTIRDLVGVDFRPGDEFPSDDVGEGFDNIGDVLSMSPLLVEKYLDAAEKIANAAVVIPQPRVMRYDTFTTEGGVQDRSGELGFFSNGTASVAYTAASSGAYRLRVLAWADQAGPELAKMAILVDGRRVAQVEVRGTRATPLAYEVPVELKAGRHEIGVGFTNDYYMPNDPDPKQRDRNLYVGSLEVISSVEQKLPASHRAIIPVDPQPGAERAAAQQILKRFARRAYRRPVTDADLKPLMAAFDLAAKEKEPFEQGIRLGITMALASPNFLFKVEKRTGKPRNLDAHEVATRLSYFLWSTMPDERLFSLADSGELVKPAVLGREVSRMLQDPKARALGDNFASQWLQLRKLETVNPDPEKFKFDDALRKSMMQETLQFFQHVVSEDLPVTTFLDADYSYLNERLATHYGIEGVQGEAYRRVKLQGQRMGILTQASVLTVTSNPTRTSPVKRGKWILENILDDPPPPPPPGADNLGDERKALEGKTLREVMAQHRKNPSCATCHIRMDALGFGLENFDAVGRWRQVYADGLPIDPTGKLPDGRSFTTPKELVATLKKDQDRFVKALAHRLLVYALGRGLTPDDHCSWEEVVKKVKASGYRFSALVQAVVTSDPFLKTGG